MPTRRKFLRTFPALAGMVAAAGCTAGDGEAAYHQAVQGIWRHGNFDDATPSLIQHELVRYAMLAPSSHNTQCWKFRIAGKTISILPDLSRRCPVVDPDDHHLFVSLGCAAENLQQAAAAFGLRGHHQVTTGDRTAIDITFEAMPALRSPLFEAIPLRQSTRGEFDGQPLSKEELKLLEAAGTGNGVKVMLLTERQAMEAVLDFIAQGNTAQIRDPAFVRELKQWIRFNDAQALAAKDGLFSRCTGNPSLPAWLGGAMFDLFFTESAENDRYARQVRSSAGIAIFFSDEDHPAQWIEVGRAFERFALQATAIGVRNAHLNQPVEIPAIRAQFARHLGLPGGRADLVIRFGRGPAMPRSLRRPVADVMV